MAIQDDRQSVSGLVADTLPFLRRYARALTGSQTSGDKLTATTLETLLADRSIFISASSVKIGLYGVFHQIWSSVGAPVAQADNAIEAAAQKHLSELTPNTREALLLNTIEGFSVDEVGEIMGIPPQEVDHLLSVALEEMARSATGMVLIIEDEPIIAMDLQNIVEELGHTVSGIARTHAEALVQFGNQKPDLILSDIQLADDSSGIEAVNEILKSAGDIPVIFITAYPEALLTGERPEPAFLIAKPYVEHMVRSSVSQAMFFSSTATLVS